MAHYFHQTHHRERFRGVPGVQPDSDHARTADAGELRVGMALAQGVDQAGAEQVT